MGVGSASIILVFAVLCLTVFSLITNVVARNDKALADAEAELVKGYYAGDTLAEQILAKIIEIAEERYDAGEHEEKIFTGIIENDAIPRTIFGVDIETSRDMDTFTAVVRYVCNLSDKKALYVELAFEMDSYEVRSWKMTDTDKWEFDDTLNVWLGD